MKKLFAIVIAGLLSSLAFAQTFPSPTFNSLTLQNPLPVSSGGSGASSSTGTGSLVLSNSPTLVTPNLGTPSAVTLTNGAGLPISTGVSGLGTGIATALSNAVTGSGSPVLATSPTVASPTITGAFNATGLVTTPDLATQAANTVLANATTSVASPTAFVMPSCSGAGSALNWTSGAGFTCAGGYALLASPTFTGTPGLSGAAGTFREFNFYTGVSARWGVYADNTAESGSNTGSNFGIAAFSDAGSALSIPLTISRATGVVQFQGPPTVGAATLYPFAPNNTALASLSTATLSTVTRLAFSAAGDAPPLVYTASASACSLNSGAGDNGSQVHSANGKCWLADFPPGPEDVREWGADNTGTNDSTTAMQAAQNTGQLIYYHGTFKFSTLNFSAGGMVGDGIGLSVLNSTDTTTANLITYTGQVFNSGTPLFRDFLLQVATPTQKSSGAGLYFSPATNEVQYVTVDNVFVFNVPISLQFIAASKFNVHNFKAYNYTAAGIVVNNTNVADSGDSTISDSFISTTITSGLGYAIQQVASGGLKIVNTKMLGGNSGFVLAFTGNMTTGDLLLSNNSIENMTNFGIFLGRNAGTNTFGAITITGNQLANNGTGISTDTSGAISQMAIAGNNIAIASGSGSAINVQSGSKFSIGPNNIIGNGGTPAGVVIGAAASNGKIEHQEFNGVSAANRIVNSSTTTLVSLDTEALTASVSTSAAYGSLFIGAAPVTFPIAFSTVPAVVCSPGTSASGAISAFPQSITTTGFSLQAIGASNSTALTGIQCVASGIQ